MDLKNLNNRHINLLLRSSRMPYMRKSSMSAAFCDVGGGRDIGGGGGRSSMSGMSHHRMKASSSARHTISDPLAEMLNVVNNATSNLNPTATNINPLDTTEDSIIPDQPQDVFVIDEFLDDNVEEVDDNINQYNKYI